MKRVNLLWLFLAIVAALAVMVSPAANADTTPYKMPAAAEKADAKKDTKHIVKQEVEEEVPESYIQDGMFTFSPEEFIERFLHFLAPTYPNALVVPSERGFEQGTEFYSEIYLSGDKSESLDGLLIFHHGDTSPIQEEDYGKHGVWCVSLEQFGDHELLGGYFSKEVLQAFFHAGDPQFTDSDFFELIIMKLTALDNATLADPIEPHGFTEHHGILYEFDHYKFDFSKPGASDDPIGIERNMMYAANWVKAARNQAKK